MEEYKVATGELEDVKVLIIEDANLSREINEILKARNVNTKSIEELEKLIETGEFKDSKHLEEINLQIQYLRKLGVK